MKDVRSKNQRQKGLTLIEVTLVIAVLISLISVVYLGAAEFKNGSNRALCIQNIVHMQKATRAYCNMHDLDPGDSITDLEVRVIDNEGFFPKKPFCPSGGTYDFVENKAPEVGSAFATCSISEHEPLNTAGW